MVLAGAFGTHIDPKYAMVLGMIPDCLLDHVRAAGNAAGTGARMALLNRARREIEAVVRRIEKIETAVEPSFQDHFVKAMAIPHKSDPYAALAGAVDLPPRDLLAEDAPALAGGRRRGRRAALTVGRRSGYVSVSDCANCRATLRAFAPA